jgi:hypothetical protein
MSGRNSFEEEKERLKGGTGSLVDENKELFGEGFEK